MLTLSGPQFQLCDGLTRRSFLKIGSLALGGLSLPQLLRAEGESGGRSSKKSVIMIFLSGGPPHQDMVDLKPEAPVEVRGEFFPHRHKCPGIQICELLPELAKRTDRLAIIRSLVGSEGRHAAFQCLTGNVVDRQPPGGWPALGAVASRLLGPVAPGIPPFMSLTPRMKGGTWGDPGQPGFCGQAHAPFAPNFEKASLELQGISRNALFARQSLREQLDGLKRTADATGSLAGTDSYYQQAFASSLRTTGRRARSGPGGPGDSRPLCRGFAGAGRVW